MGQSNSRGASVSQSRSRRASALPAVTVTPPTPTTSPLTSPAPLAKERRKSSSSYTSSFKRRSKKNKSKSKTLSVDPSALAVPSTSAPTHQQQQPEASGSRTTTSGIAFPSSSSSRHRTRSTPPNYGASSSSSSRQQSNSNNTNHNTRHSADMGLGINHGALSLAPSSEPRTTTGPKRSSLRKSIMNLVRPASLFDNSTKPDSERTAEKERERVRSVVPTANDVPTTGASMPVVIDGNRDREGDGIEEVPRDAQRLTADATKGKSRQPASDVPQDAISIASASGISTSDDRHHHPKAAAAPTSTTPTGSAPEHQDEPPHPVGVDRDQQARDENEHAVTAWFEEELERAESSAATRRADGRVAPVPATPIPTSASTGAPPASILRPTPAPISTTTPSATGANVSETAAQATSPTGTTGTGTTTTAAGGGPRHFPPPGTLVVVQGIVHTSDAPPAPPAPIAPVVPARNARPTPPSVQSSAAPSRSSTTSSGSTSIEVATGQTTPDLVEPVVAQRPVPPAISNGSIDVLGTLLSVAASATAASLLTGNAPTWNNPPLDGSRGSTAASPSRDTPRNATANANAIRHRHHHQHQQHPRPPTPSPILPSLGAHHQEGTQLEAGMGEGLQQHVGRAERLRTAWGTMLDRLGWSSSSGSTTRDRDPTPPGAFPASSSTSSASVAPGPGILRNGSTTPTTPHPHSHSTTVPFGASGSVGGGAEASSPRDVMLAEMARAFNIGLGLDANPSANSGLIHDSLNANAAHSPPSPGLPTAPASPPTADSPAAPVIHGTPQAAQPTVDASGNPIPAHGTFDRFLHDIQTDLRVALTPPDEAEVERGEREERERMEREHEERERALRGQPELSTLEAEINVTRGVRDRTGSVEATSQLREYQERHRLRETELRDRPTIDTSVVSPIPAHETAATSTSPLAASSSTSTTTTSPIPTSTAATTPAPAAATTTPTREPLSLAELSVASTTGSGTTALGSGRIDVTGRINWWRMYRFPAVTSVPGAAGATRSNPASPATGSPASPITASSTVPSSTAAPTPAPTSPTNPTNILPNFPAPPAGQPVVPVIVVGLQSVNSAWQQEELANIAAAAGGPEAASAIRRSSVAGSSTLGSPTLPSSPTTGGGVLGRGVTSSPSPPVSPVMRPQSPTSPVSPTHTTSSTSSGRRRRERRQWTQEEIEASPFGWPPMDWDESDEEDEEEHGEGAREEEEEGEEEVQRMIDEQQRRREERSAFRTSRAAGAEGEPPILDSAPTSPLPTTNATTTAPAAVPDSTNTTGAARTFLIYVVGGYYPPDHTIVTGGLDNFESFEALLELAEMLGHSKPPTVTKEDIDKSGLETIKPWQLTQYEDEGRVSYNCIERCLICLDDYDEEDDIRIMSCRHAFHKDCVDKWLQTGKNNCPACRSTGVGSS